MAQHMDPRGSKRTVPERPPAAVWTQDARAMRRDREFADALAHRGLEIVAVRENHLEVRDTATGRSAAVPRMSYESHLRTGHPSAAAVLRLVEKYLGVAK